MEIIHVVMSPLRDPMPSEPSRTDEVDEDEWMRGLGCNWRCRSFVLVSPIAVV